MTEYAVTDITKTNQSFIDVEQQAFHFARSVHCSIVVYLQCFKQSVNTYMRQKLHII